MEDLCKGNKLNCRASDPCKIECDAKTTCSSGATVNGMSSTDVTVLCDQHDSCKGIMYSICWLLKLFLNHKDLNTFGVAVEDAYLFAKAVLRVKVSELSMFQDLLHLNAMDIVQLMFHRHSQSQCPLLQSHQQHQRHRVMYKQHSLTAT